MGSSLSSVRCWTLPIKKSCWFTYTWTQDAPPLKSWRVCAQCYVEWIVRIEWRRGEFLIHASVSGPLYDMRGRTSSRSLFQKSRSICQLTLESKVGRLSLCSHPCSGSQNHLLSIGEVDLFRDNHEPSQDDSNLAAPLLSFFLQGVESRNLVP